MHIKQKKKPSDKTVAVVLPVDWRDIEVCFRREKLIAITTLKLEKEATVAFMIYSHLLYFSWWCFQERFFRATKSLAQQLSNHYIFSK